MPRIMKRVFSKKDLSKIISEKHKLIYKKDDFFKPISIAIQGNNYCSLGTCPHCGICATNDFKKSEKLPKRIILNLLKQAYDNGIFIYYTNFTGEITDDLDFFEEILKKNPKMDAHKFNTNCSKFTSLKKAKKIFNKIRQIGWTNTNYVVPTCVLSIGMQEHKIPLINVAHGIEAFKTTFNKSEAKLLISHYYTNFLYKDTFKRLQKLYKETYGKTITKKILKTDPISHYGRAKNLAMPHFELKPLSKWVSELNCFGYWHEKYICPEIYVHRDYNIYTCPLFEPHKNLKIGNTKKDSITKAIKNANKNPFLRLISQKGTKGIYNLLKSEYPEMKKIKVTNRHEACEILGNYYQKLTKK